MTATTKFQKTYYGNIETVTAPNPRLSAELSSTATTVYLTSGLLTNAGAKPTDTTILGIKNRDTGYTELIAVTSANVSTDGKTLSNVVRGLARDGDAGTDLTTSVTANQTSHPQDSEVRVTVAPQIFEMMKQALQGAIASGGTSWSIGTDTDVDIKVYAANGDANKPYWGYSSASNVWVFSNDGVSSTPFGTGAGVTGGDGITVTAGDIGADLTDTVIYKNARTGNEIRVPITAVGDGKLDKTFMPTYVENLIDSGTTVAEIDQALDGISANVTAANLGTLTGGVASNADALHTHAAPQRIASQSINATSAGAVITYTFSFIPRIIHLFGNLYAHSGATTDIRIVLINGVYVSDKFSGTTVTTNSNYYDNGHTWGTPQLDVSSITGGNDKTATAVTAAFAQVNNVFTITVSSADNTGLAAFGVIGER